MAIRIGTSGYTYPEWRGSFYPAGLPASEMLTYYAERFDTVEVNYTFYRMPNARTIAGWAAGTPAHFAFALKAPKRITHDARLRDVAEPLRYFVETVQGLGAKLGPVLFQLPPTFRKDVDRLVELLVLLPGGLRCVFEFRHLSWLADEVYDALRARNAALCVADTPDATTPIVSTADFGYFRLRDEGYTPADLETWSQALRRAEWRDTYVYFKHEASGLGPALARDLAALLLKAPREART